MFYNTVFDIFTSLSVLDDSLYTLCHMDDFKYLADMVEHIKLPLKVSFSHTVWKLQDFSITQILREINFWDSWSVKTAVFAILEAVMNIDDLACSSLQIV